MRNAFVGLGLFTIMTGIAGWVTTGATQVLDESTGSDGVEIELTLIEEDITRFAAFQSFNRKVAVNDNGIFVTYLRDFITASSIRDERKPQWHQWRLVRSSDGGKTFETLHGGGNSSSIPVIATDDANNIYVAHPHFPEGRAYFYRFLAARDYHDPEVTILPEADGGKFYLAWDPAREVLHYISKERKLFTVDTHGRILHIRDILKKGPNANYEYPALCVSSDGVLHLAWTSVQYLGGEDYFYWSIQYMRSPDGGESWENMRGEPLETPAIADDTGPTTRLSLDDEFKVHSYMASMTARPGQVFLAYKASLDELSPEGAPQRLHLMRFNSLTGEREADFVPTVEGQPDVSFNASGTLFLGGDAPNDPIYYVTGKDQGLICLRNRDAGDEWEVLARTDPLTAPYSISGMPTVAADGKLYGTFADTRSVDNASRGGWLYFYQLDPQANR